MLCWGSQTQFHIGTQFQCVGFPMQDTKQFSNNSRVSENSILTLSAGRQHRIPQAKDSVLQDFPPRPSCPPTCQSQAPGY